MARLIGPPARLYRWRDNKQGRRYLQTFNRFTGEWKYQGQERSWALAVDLQVTMGIAAVIGESACLPRTDALPRTD